MSTNYHSPERCRGQPKFTIKRDDLFPNYPNGLKRSPTMLDYNQSIWRLQFLTAAAPIQSSLTRCMSDDEDTWEPGTDTYIYADTFSALNGQIREIKVSSLALFTHIPSASELANVRI
jgi:hypothetical protein